MKLIDHPRYVSVDTYENSINSMVDKLISQPAIQTIYQIGGLSSPGISDIDLLIIFHDDMKCTYNPLSNLTEIESYLYIHNLYGLSESNFKQAQQFPLFQDYRHLWGKDHKPAPNEISDAILKTQIGLEFLIKMFISMTVERTYKIIKVRNLLLHIKALLIDAEYLGITSGNFIDMINEIVIWRSCWFDKEPMPKVVKEWHEEFYHELYRLLDSSIKNEAFFIPEWASLNIGKNLTITPSSSFGCSHRGLTLPSMFGGLGRKYFNIQNRFNKFDFSLPMVQRDIPETLEIRHKLYTQLSEFNKKNYPYFIPVVYGLPVYRRY